MLQWVQGVGTCDYDPESPEFRVQITLLRHLGTGTMFVIVSALLASLHWTVHPAPLK